MDCENSVIRISAYVDAALPGNERVRLVEHLQDCAGCRKEHLSLEHAKALISGETLHPMPDALRSRVEGMIGERRRASIGSPVKKWLDILLPSDPRWALVGAMAAAVVAIVAGTNLLPPEKPKVPLSTLLAEHARSSRKSTDIHRAILAAAPYDYVSRTRAMQ